MKITQFLSKHKGFRQFLVKIGILIVIFLLLPIFIYPFLEMSRYSLANPDPLGHFFLVDLGSSVCFAILAFILLAREKLFKIKSQRFNKQEGIIFSSLALFFLITYLLARYFTAHNSIVTFEHLSFFVFILIASIILFFASLFLAIFNMEFLNNFRRFSKEIFFSFSLVAIFYFFILKIRTSWWFLGKFVANSVAFLLKLSYGNEVLVNISEKKLMLGLKGFNASIGTPCSGIESLILFTGLFLFILFYDWKILNKSKMFIALVIGLIGTVFMNIFRIYLLYLSSLYISPNFAIGMFHSNIGWVLFLGYFFIFWWFVYGRVKKTCAQN